MDHSSNLRPDEYDEILSLVSGALSDYQNMTAQSEARDRVRLEIRALLDEEFLVVNNREYESLTDSITTAVMESAAPGVVSSIESIAHVQEGYACKFQTVYPNQRERIGFYNTAVIPEPVAMALKDLAA